MYKIFSPFGLYWHFILDVILTHVLAIYFLSIKLPMIASIVMSMDAMFKIFLSVVISRLILKIPLRDRGKISTIIRFSLIILFFIAVKLLLYPHAMIMIALLPFILFKILLLFDSALSAEFIFSFREYFHSSISQISAAQNVLIRASTAFAPAIALMILSVHYTSLIAFGVIVIIAITSTFSLRKIFFSPYTKASFNHSTNVLPLKKLLANPLMRWGLMYQIGCNLSFAGVALLFLSQLNVHGSIILNEITVLYSSFLLAQSAVLIFGEQAIPANNTFHISIILAACSIFIIVASICPAGAMRLMVCSLIGFTYSFAISSVQKVIVTCLQGSQFIGYSGWVQTAGRLSSLISTVLLGVLMNMGIASSSLLIGCGLLGIISSVLLGKQDLSKFIWETYLSSENL